MNYREFSQDYPELFREAFNDLDMYKVAKLMDEADWIGLGWMIEGSIQAAMEGVEKNTVKGGEYGEEARLDTRDRTREVNRELE